MAFYGADTKHMINVVVGKPGSGKTYYLVKKAHKFLRQGRDVYSNFYIDFKSYDQETRKKFINRWLGKFYNLPFVRNVRLRFFNKKDRRLGKLYFWNELEDLLEIRGGEILIDECQIYFNSRSWKKLPFRLQYKFQQHRKHIKKNNDGSYMALNIWGAVQNVKRIDTVVRELVNNIYSLKKVGLLFRACLYDIEDIDKEKRKPYKVSLFLFDKHLAKCYDTFQEITGFKDK